MKNEFVNKSKKLSYLLATRSTDKMELTIEGNSNSPFLTSGDRIRVNRIYNNDYKIGQLVLFWSEAEKSLFVHRIVSIKHNLIVTKGDNNWFCDQPNANKNIYGIVVKRNKKLLKLSFPYTILIYKPLAIYSYATGFLFGLLKTKFNIEFCDPEESKLFMVYRIPIYFFYLLEKALNKFI